eukprot:CAMPEP_0175828204 /NCGR_PEP_ID=MMETSP0107_2-20121207/12684_1 /TAXON_ID=195067 ORGANISM="Goniomonas pacifica, Strain CCMP1869" /NCGR_SAMPLE_ID=MMETSP0107_2 /ASSEMBLY_ACC=CAM_ASM_000203 /LENGTH=51 /DNA_ID=CAMNT_0017140915 /DNA_START=982 /DNA_END=1137 /DNA_ORIENTATION=+
MTNVNAVGDCGQNHDLVEYRVQCRFSVLRSRRPKHLGAVKSAQCVLKPRLV